MFNRGQFGKSSQYCSYQSRKDKPEPIFSETVSLYNKTPFLPVISSTPSAQKNLPQDQFFLNAVQSFEIFFRSHTANLVFRRLQITTTLLKRGANKTCSIQFHHRLDLSGPNHFIETKHFRLEHSTDLA